MRGLNFNPPHTQSVHHDELLLTLRIILQRDEKMTYYDFFIYTPFYWDYNRGFEIVQELIDSVKKEINGFNFNRYGTEGSLRPDNRVHITVRLDIKHNDSLERIERKLDEMEDQRIIEDWRSEDDNYDIRPMRDYPPVYHTAHETSTACAFRFWSELKKDADELQQFTQNRIQYLEPFFAQWLKYSGFSLLKNLSIDINSFRNNLSRKCSKSFKKTVNKKHIGNNSALFSSRLVHLFLNCICF